MLTEILLLSGALMFLYLSYKYSVDRPKGFPPGPPKLPIFGSYLYMMLSDFKYLHKGVLKFTKWYNSDIVGFHFGSFPVVAVHNAEGVREVLTNSVFDGRTATFLAEMRHPQFRLLGIFFQEGLFWKEQRRFILRYMRDFGFGRRFQQLELVINEDITDMLDMIRNGPRYEHEHFLVQNEGYRVCLPHLFNPFSVNSLLHIIINERRTRADQADLVELARLGLIFQRKTDDYGKMLSIIPWVRKVFPNFSCYNQIMEANRYMFKFYGDIIDRYEATYDESAERNFVDMYIREMKNAEEIGDTETSYQRDQFIMSLIDFTFPSFTAVGATIAFLIQYLMLYPEVLKRIQREIDEVVGHGRLPSLDDRKNMPYTEATIREGMRIETLVPSDVPHKAMADTELMGYKVPKGTVVVPSLYAYHRDPRVWGDPENFRPERFLDDNGNLCLKKDESLPFGAGKRLCAGETFARNMLFLMTSAFCQNFNFVLAPGDKMPDLSKTLSGLITSPPDFWLQLEERN